MDISGTSRVSSGPSLRTSPTASDTARRIMPDVYVGSGGRSRAVGSAAVNPLVQSVGAITNGIRSWTTENGPAAGRVTILNVSVLTPYASEALQIPPNASVSPSSRVMKYGCFLPFEARHSYQPSAGTRHRRCANGWANARDAATVSDRALIILAAPEESVAQDGTSPHRATDRTRSGVRAVCRTIGTGSVGATL